VTHNVYALIPIRMGSKGIPNKNIRKIGSKTLLEIAIERCLASESFDEIIVSSENLDVLEFAQSLGVKVHKRSLLNSNDSATLEDVALEVVTDLNLVSGSLAIVQATSPSFDGLGLRQVILNHLDKHKATSILVKPVYHLHWRIASGITQPLFNKRVNRQYMEPELFSETGAILVTEIEQLLSHKKISTSDPNLVIASFDFEDIDTMWDFYETKNRLEGLTVLFRITANSRVGSGHLYHALQVADELPEFRKIFITYDCDSFVNVKLAERGHLFLEQKSHRLTDLLRENGIAPENSVLVNDTLDTDQNFWDDFKDLGLRTIAIEDLGAGPVNADVTINALYSASLSPEHAVLTGAKWTPLRSEFDLAKMSARHRAQGKLRLTLSFGGVDPSNLTQRISSLLETVSDQVDVRVILGVGYKHNLSTSLETLANPESFESELAASDIVVTSGGRTVYEASFLGKPCIVIAQNERETRHNHLDEKYGVLYLGLNNEVSDQVFLQAVRNLVQSESLRTELGTLAAKNVDGKGAKRIAWLVKSLLEDAPVRELIDTRVYKSDQRIG